MLYKPYTDLIYKIKNFPSLGSGIGSEILKNLSQVSRWLWLSIVQGKKVTDQLSSIQMEISSDKLFQS